MTWRNPSPDLSEEKAALVLKLVGQRFPSLGTGPCAFASDGNCVEHNGFPPEAHKPMAKGLVCGLGYDKAQDIMQQGRAVNREKAVDAIAQGLMEDIGYLPRKGKVDIRRTS